MTVFAPPICMACVHLQEGGEVLSCKAYPAGIPEAIITWEVVHDQPYEGDHGIQFQQDPKAPYSKAELLELGAE